MKENFIHASSFYISRDTAKIVNARLSLLSQTTIILNNLCTNFITDLIPMWRRLPDAKKYPLKSTIGKLNKASIEANKKLVYFSNGIYLDMFDDVTDRVCEKIERSVTLLRINIENYLLKRNILHHREVAFAIVTSWIVAHAEKFWEQDYNSIPHVNGVRDIKTDLYFLNPYGFVKAMNDFMDDAKITENPIVDDEYCRYFGTEITKILYNPLSLNDIVSSEIQNSKDIKKCSVCNHVLPIDEFYKDKTTRDGLYYCCKKCAIKKSRERHLRNKKRKVLSKVNIINTKDIETHKNKQRINKFYKEMQQLNTLRNG